ncbi:hypothetical protein ACSBOX_11940 [Arthrobacter sp. KN11-1C]|uniref:hypothetical protein n=1 Tax=Arthrobacter sp. KN11-1C TaxID=3445774 RepID=UPI003FA0670D
MNAPLEYSRERNPVRLKAANLDELRRKPREDMISELRVGTNIMLRKHLEMTAEADRLRTTEFKIFTYKGLIARAETEIAWARRGLELIDHLDGA